jgi:purine-nucleoside phosphorylase
MRVRQTNYANCFRSLLGMHSPPTFTSFNHAPTMTTLDQATAAFFAVALLAETDALSSTTTCDNTMKATEVNKAAADNNNINNMGVEHAM